MLLEAIDSTRHASGLWIELLRPYFFWVFASTHRSLSSSFAYARRKFLDLDEGTQKSIFVTTVLALAVLATERLVERSKVVSVLKGKYDKQVVKARLAWRKASKRIGRSSRVLADLLPHLVLIALFGFYLALTPPQARRSLSGDPC